MILEDLVSASKAKHVFLTNFDAQFERILDEGEILFKAGSKKTKPISPDKKLADKIFSALKPRLN